MALQIREKTESRQKAVAAWINCVGALSDMGDIDKNMFDTSEILEKIEYLMAIAEEVIFEDRDEVINYDFDDLYNLISELNNN